MHFPYAAQEVEILAEIAENQKNWKLNGISGQVKNVEISMNLNESCVVEENISRS